ncbi:MBL fold metallo-hydrolase [Azospirillum sp.]|uniref:MBL fold metallo-hydrolase n=1 Tax=Azospirillum sp. TaxID=34012 RepID=UPI003D716A3E
MAPDDSRFRAAAGQAAVPQPVAPGVWWLRLALPFALDHVNVYILDDGDAWTVVDTGLSDADTRAAWTGALSVLPGAKPVARVVATHHHVDHVGLAPWFVERFGAELLMTQREWLWGRLLGVDDTPERPEAFARFFRQAGFSEAEAAEMVRQGDAYRRFVLPLPAAYRRLCDGDVLEAGGRRWRLLCCPGHSSEHLCLYDPQGRILLAGDHVLPTISPNVSVWPSDPDADPLAEYLTSLRRVAEEVDPDTLVLPGHGAPFHGLHPRIDWLLDHHADRLLLVLDACRTPVALRDVVPALFERALSDHQMVFAVGETAAHVNHLLRQGELRRETAPDGTPRLLAAT